MKEYFKKHYLKIMPILLCVILSLFCGHLIKQSILQRHEKQQLQEQIHEMERRQIKAANLKEEVRQISKYSAYEFHYTSVICFSEKRNIGGVEIPLTKSNFFATVDGVMNIGIDGKKIQFTTETDSEGNVTLVKILVPHAQILDNYTIQESLQVYDETNNILNPIKISDYSDLIAEAEKLEEEKVRNSDMLQKSDETIQYLLTTHLTAVYKDGVKIKYEYLEQQK